jgi:DNA-binding response OmpR family regulator
VGNLFEAGTSILVVDDDDDLRAAVVQALQPLGHEIRTAANGCEALSGVHQRRPALILLDVHLPDVSGYEVCRELRDEFGDGLPIIFVSGRRTDEYDRVAGLMLGADDYLVKPFAVGELIARVRRAIERSSQPDAGADVALTRREREVLGLLAAGESQVAISAKLFITPKTVATHIQHILGKLGLHSRAEAVAYAHRNRL